MGHVDHGKCLAIDEDILINNRLVSGQELVRLAKSSGNLIFSKKNEWMYDVPNLYTYSLDHKLRIVRTKAKVFIQRYKGTILTILTKNGRNIKVTQDHPLLVNKNGNLEWKKAIAISVGDCIAISRFGTLPSKIKFKSNYLKELKKKYPLVMTHKDYLRLKEKTKNFTNFSGLNEKDFNVLRILGNFSYNEITSAINFSKSWTNKILTQKNKITSNVRLRLSNFFKNNKSRLVSVSKDEILVGYKARHSGKNYTKFKDVNFVDEDVVKWFAFLHAEGCVNNKRIVVAQKNYPRLLEEFRRISERKFGVMPKKVIRETDKVKRYEIYSKPFIDYLSLKFSLKTETSRDASICDWIISLPINFQALFLKYFFALESDVRKDVIKVSQVNKRNINLLSIMLNNFGIDHRLDIQKRSKQGRKWVEYYILIEGRDNLRKFLSNVGIHDKNKLKKVKNHIRTIKLTNPLSYSTIPISPKILRLITQCLPNYTLKKIYYYYQNGRISEQQLKKIVKDLDLWIKNVEKVVNSKQKKNLHEIVKKLKISQILLAKKIGCSKSVIHGLLKNKVKSKRMCNIINQLAKEKLEKMKVIYQILNLLISSSIKWDRVKRVESSQYDDYVIDLVVPNYHNFIGGFGGVICHNSTLVEAITSRWPATHSEELKRGITIRLGYADATFYKCPKCGSYLTSEKCPKCFVKTEILRTVSFVDAPGHESLMATVLTGSALMDGAILVIAADEKCPLPQTREHLTTLELVGIKNIIIVQNKIDLVTPERAKKSYEEIKNFVKDRVPENTPIIPVSAQQKINIEYVIEAIENFIPTPKRNLDADPKMLVARSFDINKPGVTPDKLNGGVIGGAIIQGKFKVDQDIEIRPGIRVGSEWKPITTKIVSMEKAGKKLEEATAGGLLGVQTKLDPYFTKADGLVGNVVGIPEKLPKVWQKLKLKTKLLKRVVGSKEMSEVKMIKPEEILMVNVGTARSIGTVKGIKGNEIEMELKIPVCADKEDRIVLSRQVFGRWRLIGMGTII